MKKRREFIKLSVLTGGAIIASSCQTNAKPSDQIQNEELIEGSKPIVISTWKHGQEANMSAWEVLKSKGNALDAVEKGVMVSESNPENRTVGLGGRPDRSGKVTLDACIMNHKNECGAVAFLQNIENPIAVARKVMEETKHILLAGKGAYDFAIEQGFEKKNLLTDQSKDDWLKWLKTEKEKSIINIENHDTIGMLALDENGNLSGACTTSGLAYKMHGRVGDSPIIGAGLFVDNEIGAACATGIGEEVIRIAGSAIVVELMRQGKSPTQACIEAVERIIRNNNNMDGKQVGFLALNKKGEHGSYCVHAGFEYALTTNDQNKMVVSGSVMG